MPDRRAQIVRLLETRDMHLPDISRTSSSAVAGFAHNTLAPVVCPTCDGLDPHCAECHGRFYIEVKRERDPYAENKTVRYGANGSQHDASHARDQTIARLEQQLRPPSEVDELAQANEHGYSWETARRRMYRDYDYAHLDYALEALRLVDPDGYRILHAVHVYAWMPAPHPNTVYATVIDAALAFISDLMPPEIRAPEPPPPPQPGGPVKRGAGRKLYAARDERIRRRVITDGEPTALVALAEGLSISQINRIVSKGEIDERRTA